MRNTIAGNDPWGIAVRQSLGCISPIPGWECFYSSGNTINGNVVQGNRIDLFHDAGSTPNTWCSNTYETKEGTDIPNCRPPLPALQLLLD